jgi:predicted dehydrogenase
MRDQKLRVGLIGLGGISRAHEPGHRAMADIAEITAMCDVNEAAAIERAKPHGAKAYTNYEDLVADANVDLVDIMVPHHLHYPIAKAALLNDKHVLMEKPLTVLAADALELCQIAAERGLKFTVAENTRFVTAYLAAEKLIQEGALGDIRLVRTFIYGSEMFRLHRPDDWIQKNVESGGGAMMDMAPHSLYLLKWLFGEFEDVQAVQWQYVPHIEVPDNAVITGRFKSGGIFTTQYTETVEVPWGERLEVYGSTGSIIIDQLTNPVGTFYANGTDYKGRPLEGVPYEPMAWKYKSMLAEVADFIQAVWDDRPPTIDPMDGYYVIKAVEKSYESAAHGRPVTVG